MRIFILRIIKLLYKIGVIKEIWNVTYKGKIFSLNDLYKQGHWSRRSVLKNKYFEIFKDLIEDVGVEKMSSYYLLIFYRTRHDVDNIVGAAKVFVDTMRKTIVKDDDSSRYNGLFILYDKDLEMNTIEFIILKNG